MAPTFSTKCYAQNWSNQWLDYFSTLTLMPYLLRILVLRAIMAPGRQATQQLSPLSWATLQARIQGTNVAQRPWGERHIFVFKIISQRWITSTCLHENTYRFHSLHSSRTHLSSTPIIQRTRCTLWLWPEAARWSHSPGTPLLKVEEKPCVEELKFEM